LSSADSDSFDYASLASSNVFELSDRELKTLIVRLHETRSNFLGSVTPSVSQMNQQIELAQHELSSRETRRLARLSIGISVLAIVLAAGGLLF
tara:strand:+ start:312 stop:590 length:279 start_codon:yes stop_codon:yes gene_type:complete